MVGEKENRWWKKKEDRWVGKGELKWVIENLSDEKGQISFFIEFY